MNRIFKNILKVAIPAAVVGYFGYQGMFFSEDTYVTGAVVDERYIPRSLEEKTHNGIFSSHDYVGMGESQYFVTINSEGRLWVLDVQDSYRAGSKESLDQVLEEGNVVTFKKGYKRWNRAGTVQYYSDFSNGRGNIWTSEIQVH